MKVKLLKKVRKRFSIEKITSPPNRESLLLDYWKIYNSPFYILRDENNSWRCLPNREIAPLKELLIKWIFSDYSDERNHYKPANKVKVWWTGKQN